MKTPDFYAIQFKDSHVIDFTVDNIKGVFRINQTIGINDCLEHIESCREFFNKFDTVDCSALETPHCFEPKKYLEEIGITHPLLDNHYRINKAISYRSMRNVPSMKQCSLANCYTQEIAENGITLLFWDEVECEQKKLFCFFPFEKT